MYWLCISMFQHYGRVYNLKTKRMSSNKTIKFTPLFGQVRYPSRFNVCTLINCCGRLRLYFDYYRHCCLPWNFFGSRCGSNGIASYQNWCTTPPPPPPPQKKKTKKNQKNKQNKTTITKFPISSLNISL